MKIATILHRLDAVAKQHSVRAEIERREGELFRFAYDQIVSLEHRVRVLTKENEELRGIMTVNEKSNNKDYHFTCGQHAEDEPGVRRIGIRMPDCEYVVGLEEVRKLRDALIEVLPIDQLLYCPNCGAQHIDEAQPEKGWSNPAHRSHECQACRGDQGEPFVWRPADVATNGVREIRTKGKVDHNPAPIYLREARESVVLSGEE